MSEIFVGIDLGGTNIKFGCFDGDMNLISQTSVPTNADMGPKVVVVTDGARGVYVATEKQVLFHPSLSVDVIDTLGAGDAFGSCFVGALRRGLSCEEALRCGIVNSASVIGFMGAKPGLLSYDEVEKRACALRPELLLRYEL